MTNTIPATIYTWNDPGCLDNNHLDQADEITHNVAPGRYNILDTVCEQHAFSTDHRKTFAGLLLLLNSIGPILCCRQPPLDAVPYSLRDRMKRICVRLVLITAGQETDIPWLAKAA